MKNTVFAKNAVLSACALVMSAGLFAPQPGAAQGAAAVGGGDKPAAFRSRAAADLGGR